MLTVTDPVLIFAILALVMLVAPVFADRLRIPDLVLLLLAGAVLGPHGLHILDRSSAVTMLGSVGLLYIMFLAGLEIDLFRFMRSYRKSVVFGLLTFLIPQLLGTLAGHYLLGMGWAASILLASLFASHTLLAYPLASRLGIARSEPVAITVGATIITDTLALIVLAVIADMARGVTLNFGFWVTVILGIGTLSLLIWKVVPYVSRWFFQNVTEKSNAQFLFVMVAVCALGYLSHFAKMEPIIGAFLVGAAFNRLIPENSPLMSRITFAGHTLFIPFFLISVGMLVDPAAMLTGSRSWIVGGTMVVMVIVTKYAAATLCRLLFGYTSAAGKVMFGLSVVQAAATLAAVVVGHDLGIFDDTVLNGAISMILVTCPLGSWMVARYGRQMALETPVPVSTALASQRILIPVTHISTATRLLDLAFLLRNEARPGGIYPLTIVPDQSNADAAVDAAENLLGSCLAHAASADILIEPSLRMAVNVSDSIVQVSRERRAGIVLLNWSGRSTSSIRIFGSVMQNLVQNCFSQLIVCRLTTPFNTAKRLMVLFPPFASRRRDIGVFIQNIKWLAHRAGLELWVYLPGLREGDALTALLKQTKPDCPLNFADGEAWSQARAAMFNAIAPDDVIVLPLDRRNGIMWSPEMDRLAELVSSRFPQNNLLICYPSLAMLDTQTDELTEISAEESYFPVQLPFELAHGVTLEEALHHLTAVAFPDHPHEALAAFSSLLASAHSYPVELAAGMVLLHARFGNLPRAQLMVCHAPEGWRFESLPEPAVWILVLLGSKERPPEDHLKTLSAVAGRLHSIEEKQQLNPATSAAELCALLAEEPSGG